MKPLLVDRFFDAVLETLPPRGKVVSIVVTHILPDRPALLRALNKASDLGLVLAKPRSIDEPTKGRLSVEYRLEIARERFTDPVAAAEQLSRYSGARPAVILDGGLFCIGGG